MPEEIVSRVLRLPGYGVYAWDVDEATGLLTLWIRQTTREPYYVCGGCGISVREIHSLDGATDRVGDDRVTCSCFDRRVRLQSACC